MEKPDCFPFLCLWRIWCENVSLFFFHFINIKWPGQILYNTLWVQTARSLLQLVCFPPFNLLFLFLHLFLLFPFSSLWLRKLRGKWTFGDCLMEVSEFVLGRRSSENAFLFFSFSWVKAKTETELMGQFVIIWHEFSVINQQKWHSEWKNVIKHVLPHFFL